MCLAVRPAAGPRQAVSPRPLGARVPLRASPFRQTSGCVRSCQEPRSRWTMPGSGGQRGAVLTSFSHPVPLLTAALEWVPKERLLPHD